MSGTVFLAVLAAAFMHAAWNAVLKVRLDRLAAISLMSLGMAAISLAALAVVPLPQGITWMWIAASAILHTGYKIFLVKAYDSGDMAQTYPLARGTAPLLTAVGGALLLGEPADGFTALGIALLSVGIWLMSVRGGGPAAAIAPRAVLYALVTSVFIAGYTLTDGAGARSAVSVSSYAAWLFVIDGVWMFAFCLAVRGPAVLAVMLPQWRIGLAAGALSLAAYWIVLWAMTQAPIAAVAALRETSIIFATAIGVLIFREKIDARRIAIIFMIAAGAILVETG